jgi:hypothetical protein
LSSNPLNGRKDCCFWVIALPHFCLITFCPIWIIVWVLSISFISSFSPLYRWAIAALHSMEILKDNQSEHVCTDPAGFKSRKGTKYLWKA